MTDTSTHKSCTILTLNHYFPLPNCKLILAQGTKADKQALRRYSLLQIYHPSTIKPLYTPSAAYQNASPASQPAAAVPAEAEHLLADG
jgi:hypothetical protein